MASEYDRPFIVTLIGILYGLIAVLWIAVGIAAVILGDTFIEDMISDTDGDLLSGASIALGIASILIGILYGLICAGFMRGWSIMWYLGLIFSALAIIGGLLSLLAMQFYMVIAIAVNVLIVLYLFKPNVRLFFLKRRGTIPQLFLWSPAWTGACRNRSVRSRP